MIDLWQEIYATIRRNKLRTFLTGFAVAWGIFMLIVLLGAGNGLIHALEENVSTQALNTISVYGGWTTKPYDGLKEGRHIQLENMDLKDTEKAFPEHILSVGATTWHDMTDIAYGGEYVNHSLQGVYPNYQEINMMKITRGRFINQTDINERRKVMVLHVKSAEVLAGRQHTDLIGKFVNAGGVAYQIIGLYDDGGSSEPDRVFIPFTTLQLIYNKGNQLNSLQFTTQGLNSEEISEAFEDDYRRMISANHRFDPTDESAIWVWNNFLSYLQTQNAAGILRTAVWVIGIFTLLSGIVGVSNIMLITVRERTHEFGIRKALGAKPRSILWLIIVESVVITTLFGYIGMVAGIGATEWMDSYFGNQTADAGIFQVKMFSDPTVDLGIAIQATLTLVVAGTLAGFFPARKATKIRPIEALRAD